MSSADVMQALAEDLRLDSQRPWPGLPAFTEQQHDFFFGREQETSDLFRCVKRERLSVLFGKSGLGKTSLLQAGLFPMLRTSSFLPVYIRVNYVEGAESLETQVFAALHSAIVQADLAEVALPQTGESLWEYLHRRGGNLTDHEGNVVTPALVFDQFEECFTLGISGSSLSASGEQFLSELADLIENRLPSSLGKRFAEDRDLTRRFDLDSSGCRILITLREDYLPDLEALRDTMPSLVFIDNRLRLTEMTGSQARSVVASPNPELVAPGVPEFIVRFVAGAEAERCEGPETSGKDVPLDNLEVAPAILCLFCRQINEQRIARRQTAITRSLVESQGITIIDEFYQECITNMHPAVRRLIEDRLLTRAGFRNNIDLAEARVDLEQAGARHSCIDELVRLRLLQIEEHRGVPRLELTHDVLTDPVKRSRTRWEEEQAREKQRQEQLRAVLEAKEAEQEARKRVRYVQKMSAVITGIVILVAVLILMNVRQKHAVYLAAEDMRDRDRAAVQAKKEESEIRKDAVASKAAARDAAEKKVISDDLAIANAKLAEFNSKQDQAHVAGAQAIEKNMMDTAAKSLDLCWKMYDSFNEFTENSPDKERKAAFAQYEAFLMDPGGCMTVARDLHGLQPTNLTIADSLTRIPIQAGFSARKRDAPQDVARYSNEAVKLAESMEGETANTSLRILVARTYIGAAWVLGSSRKAEAQTNSIRGMREVADLNDRSSLSASDWDDLSDLYYWQALYLAETDEGRGRRNSEEVGAYEAAIHDEMNASRLDPKNSYYRRTGLDRALALAAYESGLKDHAEAVVLYQTILTSAREMKEDTRLREAYSRLIALFTEDKQYKKADALARERITSLTSTPKGAQRDQDLAIAYGDAALVDEEAGLWEQGVRDRVGVITTLEARDKGANKGRDRDLAVAHGNLAWMQIQAGHFADGLRSAIKGLELDDSQQWILVNKAHGLLLTEQTAAATALYHQIQDQPYQTRLLKDDILSDFLTLCKLTYVHPAMKGIAEGLHNEKHQNYPLLMNCLAAAPMNAASAAHAP